MRLYYFTSAQLAISNIALKRIKISRFSDLNDPFELLAVNLSDRDSRKIFHKEREKVNETRGLICFSKEWKNPLMWGHYADKHNGIALGFEIPQKNVTPVIYDRNLSKVEIDAKTNNPTKSLIEELLRIKFEDWAYEKEMRLFVSLENITPEGSYYFEDFSDALNLREVILGPKCTIPIDRIRNLVSGYKLKVEVIKSRIAFTRFEVLKNKAASKIDRNV
jgi:hypothetical protein